MSVTGYVRILAESADGRHYPGEWVEWVGVVVGLEASSGHWAFRRGPAVTVVSHSGGPLFVGAVYAAEPIGPTHARTERPPRAGPPDEPITVVRIAE